MAFPIGRSTDSSRLTVGEEADATRTPGAALPNATPARLTGAVSAFRSHTQSLGPRRPPAIEAPARQLPPSGRAMPASRHDTAIRRHDLAMDRLFSVAKPERGQPSVPGSMDGMTDDAGFVREMRQTFGGARGAGLGVRLLGLVPPADDGVMPYAAPLVLATALRASGAQTPDQAWALLDAVQSGAPSPGVFRLQRILASTTTGMHALNRLQRTQDIDPAQQALHREALNLCSDLERKGLRLSAHASVDDVAGALGARPDVNIDVAIGSDTDQPLQLLAKALRHVQALQQGAPAIAASGHKDHDAYMAWKMGGFTESGKDTDFNKSIGRMHKFLTYVDRADHGPRTLKALAQEAGAFFGRAVGVGKSPLTPMRHGVLGGDLGLDHEEAAKVRAKLDQALASATDGLMAELRDPQIRGVESARTPRLARAAVFDLWRETGRTTHPLSEVSTRAGQLLAQTGASPPAIDDAALAKGLRPFTRRARADDGSPAVRIGLRALEAMAAARPRAAATPAVAQDRRQQLKDLLSELHTIEHGADPKPLFKLSDLKRVLGAAPRDGPVAADAHQVMHTLASAPRDSLSQWRDGSSRGLGTFGALPLRVGSTLGTPLVYPIAQGEQGKQAVVMFGNEATGGRMFIGTETSASGTLGLGGGWAAPPLAGGMLSVAVLAETAAAAGSSKAQGVSILARSDRDGWREKLPQVVDFMFEQAQLQPGLGRVADPGELWSRFAERFSDDPHLSVNWVEETSSNVSARAGAAAVARFNASDKVSLGPAASLGLRATRSQMHRMPNADGGDVPAGNTARQVVANASIGLAQLAPGIKATEDSPIVGWATGLPLGGTTVEWDLSFGLGTARLGRTRDGQLSARLCQREVVIGDPKVMTEYINRNRAGWEKAMVDKDPSGRTTPGDARAWLNASLQQMSDVNSPLNIHGESATLLPAVADAINGYEARLKTLLGHGDGVAEARVLTPGERAECNSLQNEARRLLKAEENWVPSALWTIENNARSTTMGLNFGARLVNQERAQVRHLNAVLVAGVPPPVPTPVPAPEPPPAR